ncbi:hypothetical protein cypCar_00005926 [Cyprinus carpio]|nr:hypothetical protein cypCar_00005926 [Cyprinus carpio]
MSNARLMPSPICLVENVNGSLSACKDAIEFLSRIHEPVVVVSVVGLYRTGKSYLMNRLAGQQSGFALGNTIESKTKGIWMWCVAHPYKEGHTLVLLDTEGLGDVAKEKVDMYYAGLLQENVMASEKKCRDLLKNLFSDMNKWLQEGKYSQSGGYELYCRDRDTIVEHYCREPNKGVSAEAVLNEFLNERGPEANSILYTDTKLTEKDRKIQEEKEKNALLEQKYKEEEEKRIESERMMQAEKERQQDQMRQMQEKFNKELEQQQQEMDRAIESKLKEREEMLKKGFSEKVDLLDEEIANLKKEKESSGGLMKEYVVPILGAVAEILPTILNYKVLMKGLKKI